MKRVLFIETYPEGLIKAFENNGFDVCVAPSYVLKIKEAEEKVSQLNTCKFGEQGDYLFTFDFDITLSKWCNEKGIIYISWSVDSPHLSLYSEFVAYPTNRIFVFDFEEYNELIAMGKDNIFYLPLATDVENLHNTAVGENKDITRFSSDVSFMGNMYDKEPHNLYDRITFLPEKVRGYIEALIAVQMKIWGMDIFKSDAFANILDEIMKYVKIDFENSYDDVVYSKFLDNMMGKKVAQIERSHLCDCLASKYRFALYTGSDTSKKPWIDNRGYVDYLTEMPIMFYNSRINININLHCICTGIPLRVLDIMACEGFCLTNYQAEVAQYFEDGKDLVMFSDFEDMCSKIDYYLQHDDERKTIAHNGYMKVKEAFDYGNVVPKLIEAL